MGPGFVILFWLIIAAILGTLWFGALVLFIIAWARKWVLIKWLSGLAVAGGLILAFLIGCFFGYGIVRSTIPRCVFKDTFHVSPGAEVHDIRSRVFWFADTGSTYLSFKTDMATFNKLVPKDLPKVTSEDYADRCWHDDGGHPDWWQPSFDPADEIYFHSPEFGQGKIFASEMTLMTYDNRTGIAYYRFLGID